MRLVCPNCGAQYEVPRGVIPDDGRDVQCSNCGNTWFEPHPDAVAARSPEPAHAPEPVTDHDPDLDYHDAGTDLGYGAEGGYDDDPGPLPDYDPDPDTESERSRVDPAVADVFREEAAFEARAREAEMTGGLESQPDLGLEEGVEDDDVRRAREAQERMSRRRGSATAPAAEVEAAVAATVAAETARPRRDQLPDIDDINATLRSSKEPRITDRDEPPPHLQVAQNDRRSFRRGFILMVLIAVALVALYVFAPRISETVPQAKAPLDTYVGFVDQGRVWLDAQVDAGLKWLDSMASEASEPVEGDAPSE